MWRDFASKPHWGGGLAEILAFELCNCKFCEKTSISKRNECPEANVSQEIRSYAMS